MSEKNQCGGRRAAASDNAKQDVHQTDPMKLGEDEKAMGEIEKRYAKRMAEISDSEAKVKTLEIQLKEQKEADPTDASGRQAKIKEEIDLLKKTE